MARQQNKSSNKHVKKTASKLENQAIIEEKVEEEIKQTPIVPDEPEKKKIQPSEIKDFCLNKVRTLAAKTKEKIPTASIKDLGAKTAQKVKSLPYKEKGKQALNGLKQGADQCGKKIKAVNWRGVGGKINGWWQKVKTCKLKDVW
ncbi:MAG: hypothetical protein J6Y91_02210, partial [Alphaproteobacteria bacterium]|nr:hypothetical protein [Alphaproteobacteria bacterium]